MRKIFLVCVAISLNYATSEFCNTCACTNVIINCNSQRLNNIPNITIFNKYSTVTTLTLEYNFIRNVKSFPPLTNLSSLSLSHNLIGVLEDSSFYNLTQLTYLDLSHNQITSEQLNPLIFKGPYNNGREVIPLKILKLGGNSIHSLHADIFEYSPALEELYLDSNPFNIIDTSTTVALATLHKIKKLDLSSTHIKQIPEGMVHSSRLLEYLDLSNNLLEYVPENLHYSISIKHLILNGNPIKTLDHFPRVPSIMTLEISWMSKLSQISAYSFSNLTNLHTLICTHNFYLTHISEKAFQLIPTSEQEGVTYPPIKKVLLDDNRLGYLDQETIGRWDNLEELNLASNPWICDCNNQWMLDTLIPVMHEQNKSIGSLICAQPIELKGQELKELTEKKTQMRCLDMYGNQPDKDAKVLIIVLVGALVAIPIALILIGYLKRPVSLSSHYPRAYYKRAVSLESVTTN